MVMAAVRGDEDAWGAWELTGRGRGIERYRRRNKVACAWGFWSKGVMRLPFSKESIAEAYMDPRHRKQWDDSYEGFTALELPDSVQNTEACCTGYRLIRLASFWPVSKRELSVVLRQERNDDGSILIWATSYEHPQADVKSKGALRADLKYAGLHVMPDGDHCIVTMIICCDIKGSVPSFVLSKLNTMYPTMLSSLRRYLRRNALDTTKADSDGGDEKQDVGDYILDFPYALANGHMVVVILLLLLVCCPWVSLFLSTACSIFFAPRHVYSTMLASLSTTEDRLIAFYHKHIDIQLISTWFIWLLLYKALFSLYPALLLASFTSLLPNVASILS